MGKTKYQKSDLENSILSYLHKARASLKAVQIAKAVGMVTARDVNPTLYKLAKLNKVVFCDGKPPVWRLGVPLSEGASSQAGNGFRNTSGRWNVVTQSDNGLSLSGTADMSMCTSSYQHNYMPHLAGFHHSGSSVGQNVCGSIVGGILTDTKVHHCHQSGYVMTSPGVKVKTHSIDVEIKAMSEKATCSTMFGQHTPMQQTMGSKGDGAPSQGGSNMFGQQTLGSEGDGAESHDCSMWVAQEQSDESSCESVVISGEDGKEVDNTIGQGYPGTPEGHCDMEVVHDTGVANMCQSAEIQDSTSSESSTEGKGLSVLNDQVRLLRALSTSDEQSVSSSPEDYSERFPVFGLNANFNISQSGCMSHDTDLQKRILHCLALSPKQHCSTLHLVQSLQLGCKKDINAMLYDMSTLGLIYRVNDSPPHWQIAPTGQSLLQDRAVGKIPGTVASFVKCDSTNEAAVGSQMHQIHNTTHMSGAFRIPLSPAEMIKSGALYGPTGGDTSEPSASRPLGVSSQSIVYHRIGIGRGIQLVQNTQTVGHTDSEALLNALKVHDPVSNSVMSLMKTGVQNTQEALTSLSSESFAALNKNPVSALMEFAQSRKSTATIEVFGQTGPSHNPRFRMAAVMGRRQFPYVTVSNKKEGKKEAAEVAVRILMSEEQIKVSNAPVGPQAALGVQATHFDKMAALCHQTFHLIISGVSVCMPGRKVMAGLVMKNGTGDDGKVISLGSGNRCITGESLSLEGQTVNDSHAEIITRRSFLRFLYRKLQAHIPEDPETIFEEAPSRKLRVKPGITFHLYITTAPCGDGALMSQRDAKPLMCNDSGTEHHPTFSSAVMGLLRTKIEGGEGTLPIKSDFVEQTWDGIVRGERLRTMSCSDKICRWNIVGMQGALLSHFLEPIYLSSLTLGYLYEESHLSRAVCCRLVHGEPDITPLLQSPYHVNHPQLGRVTLCDAQRETQKTKQYSVNWCDGDRNAEVTDGTRGICLDGNLSRVCKSVLYKDFKTTCQKLGRTDLLQNMTYLNAKQKATEFQEAKRLMTMKFKATGFGMWVSKPVEEKMFS